MDYGFYKIVHIVSIVAFFSVYAIGASRKSATKKEKIITGVLLILIMVAGMGLIAKIGIPHGSPWPIWLKIKLGIWFFMGATSHMVLKRFPDHAMKFFWLCVGLLTLASYLANYKIN